MEWDPEMFAENDDIELELNDYTNEGIYNYRNVSKLQYSRENNKNNSMC